MRKTMTVRAMLLAALALAGTTPSMAEGGAQTSGYVAVVPGSVISVNAENYPIGLGGQHFQTPSPVLSITVEDRNGPGVRVVVCQDYLSDGRGSGCVSPARADAMVEFCSTPEPVSLTDHGFRHGYTRVIIDTAPTRCPAIATTGTITITW